MCNKTNCFHRTTNGNCAIGEHPDICDSFIDEEAYLAEMEFLYQQSLEQGPMMVYGNVVDAEIEPPF